MEKKETVIIKKRDDESDKARLEYVQHENEMLQEEWKLAQEELEQLKAERSSLLDKLMKDKKYSYYYY